MKKTFDICVLDPPWDFSDRLTMSNVARGASSNYSTMSIDELKALPIKDLADPSGCLLALWCPSSLLSSGLDLMQEYGFRQTQTYVWVKNKQQPFKKILNKAAKTILSDDSITKKTITNAFTDVQEACKSHLNDVLQFGLGRLFRQTHEICLIGINNTGIYQKLTNRSQRSVSFAPNLGHSKKPEDLQDALDIMFAGKDIKKIELFARRKRDGWACLGNQIDGVDTTGGEDIRVSLDRLL